MSGVCVLSSPVWVTLALTAVLLMHRTSASNQCSIVRSHKNGDCVYNIHLTHHDGCPHDNGYQHTGYQSDQPAFQSDQADIKKHQADIQKEQADIQQRQADIQRSQADIQKQQADVQKDQADKVGSLEKTVTYLSDQHDQRLRQLEGSVKSLLGQDGSLPSVVKSSLDLDPQPFNPTPSFDTDILGRLHHELTSLRTALKHKTEQLFDVQLKANETESRFEKTQGDLLRVNEKLMTAENRVSRLERERSVLKNQIKDRSYKMDVSSELLSACEAKTSEQQQQLLVLIRSENALKESVTACQAQLNESKQELQSQETRYKDLKSRHARTRQVLGIRERELIDCYGAKTQTFCGFETKTLCGFTQASDSSDFFDWDWAQGKTPSRRTGPSADHTCGNKQGHFMFIEASAKGRGKNAIIYSPLYRGMKQQCVEFFYHMNGIHIGTLNVYAKARGAVELTSVWRAWGNQGDTWSVARLAIPRRLARAGYQIAFEGITENGYAGDISIDDVSVTDGACRTEQGVEAVVVKVRSSLILDEGKQFARNLRRLRLAKLRKLRKN